MVIAKRCYQCNTLLKQGKHVYSACDTIQCSYECMLERYKKVQTIDPELKSPSSWSSITDTGAMRINKRISPMKKTQSCVWIDINGENTMYPNTDIVIESKEKAVEKTIEKTVEKTVEKSKSIDCCYKLGYYIKYNIINIMCIIFIYCLINKY